MGRRGKRAGGGEVGDRGRRKWGGWVKRQRRV